MTMMIMVSHGASHPFGRFLVQTAGDHLRHPFVWWVLSWAWGNALSMSVYIYIYISACTNNPDHIQYGTVLMIWGCFRSQVSSFESSQIKLIKLKYINQIDFKYRLGKSQATNPLLSWQLSQPNHLSPGFHRNNFRVFDAAALAAGHTWKDPNSTVSMFIPAVQMAIDRANTPWWTIWPKVALLRPMREIARNPPGWQFPIAADTLPEALRGFRAKPKYIKIQLLTSWIIHQQFQSAVNRVLKHSKVFHGASFERHTHTHTLCGNEDTNTHRTARSSQSWMAAKPLRRIVDHRWFFILNGVPRNAIGKPSRSAFGEVIFGPFPPWRRGRHCVLLGCLHHHFTTSAWFSRGLIKCGSGLQAETKSRPRQESEASTK